MAKNREIACIYYECEGQCLKGRDGTFRDSCQKCKLYLPLRGGKPARKDLHRQKKDAVRERESRREIQNY